MRSLALDPDAGDLRVTAGRFSFVEGADAVRQRLKVRLTPWRGEWGFDRSAGGRRSNSRIRSPVPHGSGRGISGRRVNAAARGGNIGRMRVTLAAVLLVAACSAEAPPAPPRPDASCIQLCREPAARSCGACLRGHRPACVAPPDTTPEVCSVCGCTDDCADENADCDGDRVNGCEVSIAFDPNNCGACGRRCGATAPRVQRACVGGVCRDDVCELGYANCDGDLTNGCETATGAADPTNCGACDRRCEAATQCCAGTCVDLARDPTNCGACGNRCNGGYCDSGRCVVDCRLYAPGRANCDGDDTNGCETLLGTTEDCGDCGDRCGLYCDHGGRCANYACVCRG